jgi:hypothetical protein
MDIDDLNKINVLTPIVYTLLFVNCGAKQRSTKRHHMVSPSSSGTRRERSFQTLMGPNYITPSSKSEQDQTTKISFSKSRILVVSRRMRVSNLIASQASLTTTSISVKSSKIKLTEIYRQLT